LPQFLVLPFCETNLFGLDLFLCSNGVVLVLSFLKNREVGDFCKSARMAQHPITQRETKKQKMVESSPPNFLFVGKMYLWVQLLKTQDHLWRKRPLYFSRAANILWFRRDFFLGRREFAFHLLIAPKFLCTAFSFSLVRLIFF